MNATQCDEIQLPVPWGHISAKWWGRRDTRPVLVVHGILDNAGSFDRLIPLLPRHVGYLAIDLPGHGRSAHFPAGMVYSTFDYAHALDLIRVHFGWERFTLLGHSLGSVLSYVYSALHPERVDVLMGIDLLKPLQPRPQHELDRLRRHLAHLLRAHERRVAGAMAPSYTYAELVERMVKGSEGSVSAELAPYLLERAIERAPQHPDKFRFSRDDRLKAMHLMISHRELALEMARLVRAPHLYIKATESPYYENEQHFEDAIAVLKESNPLFRMVRVEGTHHVHLMNPVPVAREIGAYLEKYRTE